MEKRSLPEEGEQVFVISSSIGDSLKEDLAWSTYVLLRNTSTVAVVWCSSLPSLFLVLCFTKKVYFFSYFR